MSKHITSQFQAITPILVHLGQVPEHNETRIIPAPAKVDFSKIAADVDYALKSDPMPLTSFMMGYVGTTDIPLSFKKPGAFKPSLFFVNGANVATAIITSKTAETTPDFLEQFFDNITGAPITDYTPITGLHLGNASLDELKVMMSFLLKKSPQNGYPVAIGQPAKLQGALFTWEGIHQLQTFLKTLTRAIDDFNNAKPTPSPTDTPPTAPKLGKQNDTGSKNGSEKAQEAIDDWSNLDFNALVNDVKENGWSVKYYNGGAKPMASKERGQQTTTLRPPSPPQPPSDLPTDTPISAPSMAVEGTVGIMPRERFRRTILRMQYAAREGRRIDNKPTHRIHADITTLGQEDLHLIPRYVLRARIVTVPVPGQYETMLRGKEKPLVMTFFPAEWLNTFALIDPAADHATEKDPVFTQRLPKPKDETERDR